MSAHREWLRRSLLGGWLLVSLGSTALAQRRPAEPPRATDDPAAAEEARERQTLQRFLALLERNPRKGTPLDRVYGYHVERGTLDDFVKTLSDRVAKTPRTARAG